MSHKKAILIFRIFCKFKGLLAKNGPNRGKYRLFWSDLWSKSSENSEGFSVWLQYEKERWKIARKYLWSGLWSPGIGKALNFRGKEGNFADYRNLRNLKL
jgi:hypothetical protein